jgi:hypothetical protein
VAARGSRVKRDAQLQRALLVHVAPYLPADVPAFCHFAIAPVPHLPIVIRPALLA